MNSATALPEREILDVQFHDALAQGANPILRISVDRDIADIEIGADPRGLELVDVAREFERAEKKLVPDLLDPDDDLVLLRQGDERADMALAALPGLRVGHLGGDHGGDEQHGVRAPELGVLKARAHAREALFDHGRIGRRERAAPVLGVHDGVDREPGLSRGGKDLLGGGGIGSGGAFDLFEAGVAGDLKTVEDRHRGGEHVELDGLFNREARGSCGGHERECQKRAAGHAEIV